jgi:hypothetical protein
LFLLNEIYIPEIVKKQILLQAKLKVDFHSFY